MYGNMPRKINSVNVLYVFNDVLLQNPSHESAIFASLRLLQYYWIAWTVTTNIYMTKITFGLYRKLSSGCPNTAREKSKGAAKTPLVLMLHIQAIFSDKKGKPKSYYFPPIKKWGRRQQATKGHSWPAGDTCSVNVPLACWFCFRSMGCKACAIPVSAPPLWFF